MGLCRSKSGAKREHGQVSPGLLVKSVGGRGHFPLVHFIKSFGWTATLHSSCSFSPIADNENIAMPTKRSHELHGGLQPRKALTPSIPLTDYLGVMTGILTQNSLLKVANPDSHFPNPERGLVEGSGTKQGNSMSNRTFHDDENVLHFQLSSTEAASHTQLPST